MNYFALPQSMMTVLSLADRGATVTTAAADRAIAVWAFFTQPQAIATYKWLGAMTVAIGQLIFWSAVWCYAQIKQQVDEEVDSCLPNLVSQGEYFATTEEAFAYFDELYAVAEAAAIQATDGLPGMWEPADFLYGETDRPAQAAAIQPATATFVIPMADLLETDQGDRRTALEAMTLAQLKPIAKKLNQPTRKVRKPLLIDSIIKAEGFEV